MKSLLEVDTRKLTDDIFTTLRMDISEAEKQHFYKKYIQGMTLSIDKDGIMRIKIPD